MISQSHALYHPEEPTGILLTEEPMRILLTTDSSGSVYVPCSVIGASGHVTNVT